MFKIFKKKTEIKKHNPGEWLGRVTFNMALGSLGMAFWFLFMGYQIGRAIHRCGP